MDRSQERAASESERCRPLHSGVRLLRKDVVRVPSISKRAQRLAPRSGGRSLPQFIRCGSPDPAGHRRMLVSAPALRKCPDSRARGCVVDVDVRAACRFEPPRAEASWPVFCSPVARAPRGQARVTPRRAKEHYSRPGWLSELDVA
jgi:hypothetical protein